MYLFVRLAARTIAATLLAVLGLSFLGAGLASAADSQVSWAVRTASNDFGADRENFAYTLDPSGRLKDALVVVNHGKKPLTLAVYAADGFTSDSGQLDLDTADKVPTGVGAWLKTKGQAVTVKPGASVNVPFTMSVPKNATPGDHVGGIVTSLTQDDDAAGINVDRRLAIKVKVRVGGELAPAVKVENLHVGYSGTVNPFSKGSSTVDYTVHNTGNSILTARQAVSVSGPFGLLKVSAAAISDVPQLLPGESWKVSVPVTGVAPTGRVSGQVTLTALVTDAAGTVTPLAPIDASSGGWAVPWSAVVLIAVVIALGVVLIRRSRQAKVREDARVEAAIAQALSDRASV